jgi:hypothetical protein
MSLTECLGIQNPSFTHPQYETLDVILQGRPSSPGLDRIVLGVNENSSTAIQFVVSRLRLTGRRMEEYGAVSRRRLLRSAAAPGYSFACHAPSLSHGGNPADASPPTGLSRANAEVSENLVPPFL